MIIYRLSPSHCVKTHLNASEKQAAKTSALTKVFTLDDDYVLYVLGFI